MEQTTAEKIRQRRRQMMVHSYLYYHKDTNIVSDSKWSEWAMELVELQKKYPEESKRVEFYKEFKDWDGSSGAFLKIPENIKTVAERLYRYKNNIPMKKVKPKVKRPVKRKSVSGAKKLF